MLLKTDVLVVGAGPAGIKAALTADRAGADVILIDESVFLGGQLRSQTQYFSNLPKNIDSGLGIEIYNELENQLNNSNITVFTNHTMVGSFKNGNIGVSNGEKVLEIQSKKNILAPGAQEEALIFPGWTLPGVMTAGAAQILVNREFVRPGNEAIMVGSNIFALEVALLLQQCGVSVKAIIEEQLNIQCKDTSKLGEIGNIPIFTSSRIKAARGRGKVEQVIIETPNGENELYVDLICVANGFRPILEPFEILNCEFTYKKGLGGWIPKYDNRFLTGNPNCYVAGNAAGITDLGPILLTGEIAAWNALGELGLVSSIVVDKKIKNLWVELSRLEDEYVFKERLNLINNTSAIKY